jgi:phage replication O-like protein O
MNSSEDNTFTKFPNSILEYLAMEKIPGECWRVFLAIIRRTLGFQRDSASISLSQFEKLTHLHRPNISRSLKALQRANMIKKCDGKVSEYCMNQDIDSWEVSQLSRGTRGHVDNEKVIQVDNEKLSTGIIPVIQVDNKVLSTGIISNPVIHSDSSDSAIPKEIYKESYKEKGKERKNLSPELSNLLDNLKQYPCFSRASPDEVKELLNTYPSSQIQDECEKAVKYLKDKGRDKCDKWGWFQEKWLPHIKPEEKPLVYSVLPYIPQLCKDN